MTSNLVGSRDYVLEGQYSSEVCFFFSSRRRHTRYWRDWSSDVCSSDLAARPEERDELAPSDGERDPFERGDGAEPLRDVGELDRRLVVHGRRTLHPAPRPGIGRASCRERVEISVDAVSLKNKRSAWGQY